jgi:hypothetical protein
MLAVGDGVGGADAGGVLAADVPVVLGPAENTTVHVPFGEHAAFELLFCSVNV